MSLVEQELLTLPGHLSYHPFKWGPCCTIYSFLWSVLYIIIRPFVLVILAIPFSVLLRLTASNYPCGIIKRFLYPHNITIVYLIPLITSVVSIFSLFTFTFQFTSIIPCSTLSIRHTLIYTNIVGTRLAYQMKYYLMW